MSVLWYNKSVVTSTYVTTLTIAKKHLGICDHVVREAVSVGIHQIAYISGEFRPADVLTKILREAVKRPHIERIFY